MPASLLLVCIELLLCHFCTSFRFLPISRRKRDVSENYFQNFLYSSEIKQNLPFSPYSCLDIIQLGMKKRTAVIYRRPFLVIPNCRVKPSAEPWKRKTPKSFGDFSVFLYLVGVSGFEPEASWTRTKRDTKLRHTPIPRYYNQSSE